MDFTESQQSCIVIEKLTRQQEAGYFCDIALVVKGNEFKAHRNVLAACSEYFDSVFSKEKVVKEKIVITKCKNIAAFQMILNYMYTGIIHIDANNISDILFLASRFIMEKVKRYSEKFLLEHLNTSNIFSAQDLAIKFKLIDLQQNVTSFIQQHILEILEQKEILLFSPKKLEQFFRGIDFHIFQQELLSFICKWVDFDRKNREDCFQDFLKFINWQRINPACLEENISNYSLFSNSARSLYTFLVILKDNKIFLQEYGAKFAMLENEFGSASNVSTDSVSMKNIPELISELENDEDNCEALKTEDESIILNTLETGVIPIKAKKPRKSTHPRKVIHTPTKPKRRQNISKKQSDTDDCESNESFFEITSISTRSRKSRCKTDMGSEVKKTLIGTKRKALTSRGKSKKTRSSVIAKESAATTNKRLACEKCSFVTLSSANFEKHVIDIHSNEMMYKCSFCDFECSWVKDFTKHMKIHYPSAPYKCKLCDYSSENPSYFFHHLVTHTDVRRHICNVCGRKCISKHNLDDHMRSHTGERPFPCSICGNRFTTKRLLYLHKPIHNAEKPFLCEQCGFGTKQRKRLLYHMRKHKGDVIHCDFPGCKYSAPWMCDIINHKQTHSDVKSYICSYCGVGFTSPKYLSRHERIHSSPNSFTCNQCEFRSCRKDKLKAHLLKYHSDHPTARGAFKSRKPRVVRLLGDNEDTTNSFDDPSQVMPPEIESSNKETNIPRSITNVNQGSNVCIPQSLCPNYESLLAIQQLGAMPCHQATQLQHNGNNLHASTVPVISHEIPTQFRSFMSFM